MIIYVMSVTKFIILLTTKQRRDERHEYIDKKDGAICENNNIQLAYCNNTGPVRDIHQREILVQQNTAPT